MRKRAAGKGPQSAQDAGKVLPEPFPPGVVRSPAHGVFKRSNSLYKLWVPRFSCPTAMAAT